ncbi:MAG: response regulator [Pseudomonadota bacterium]
MRIKTKLIIGFLSVAAIIIVGGIIGITETNRLYGVSKEIGIKNVPLADAAMKVQLHATKASRWFDKIMGGVEDKALIDEVWDHLDKALWHVNTILTGDDGTFYSAVNDEAIEAKVLSVKTDLEAFIKLSHSRFDNRFGAKELDDEALDDKYDALFEKTMAGAATAGAMFHAKIAKDIKQMEIVATKSTVILSLATLFSFIIASIGIYYFSRDIMRQVGGEPAKIAQITQEVAAGNLDIEFKSGAATGIYAAVQMMVDNQKTMNNEIYKQMEEIGQQDWLKTGHGLLNDHMSGGLDIVTLSKNIISFLTTYIEAQVGIFYLLQTNKSYLEIIASYGYTASENIPHRFEIGEGLVGQAALENQTFSRTQTPDESAIIIQSCMTMVIPHHVLIIPFSYENAVKGVIEIGYSQEMPTSLQQDFMEQAMQSIGVAVNAAESRTQMQELLYQSRKQTEELRIKSEELQSNSEELQVQQEELRQLNEELEERTHELELQGSEISEKNLVLLNQQTEMKEAQVALETKAKELELANQYKSEFLANVSHELRTPLNSMLMLAQLLADDSDLNDKQVKQAQTIHSAGSDLLQLINEILDLSKIEAGKMEIQVEDVSLADLVDKIENKLRHIADDKGLVFDITLDEDLPPILRTDGQRLQQIINNLLSNAFKFTSEGDQVKLTIQRPLGAAHTVAISVADTGIGIPDDKQQYIFEAFRQAEGSTSRHYGGTGLGLSISRRLAQRLGGDLHLHSEEGKGSTFTIVLPEKLEILDSEDQDAAQTPNVETTPSAGVDGAMLDDSANLRPEDQFILIVEDDPVFTQMLMVLARENNFKCIIADNGKTGLQLAEQYKPNAILLDVILPKMDGWTVMERLKDNPDTRHIPVHFISGVENTRDAKKMGALGFCPKNTGIEGLGEAFNDIKGFLAKTLKEVLIIVDQDEQKQQMMDLIEGSNVQATVVVTVEDALEHLKKGAFDCIIIDVDVEQQAGLKLLESLYNNDRLSNIPVIVYATRHLTSSEEVLLLQYADKITLKTVSSPERLLEESTLFLHQPETRLSKDKQEMLHKVHDKGAILKNKKVLIVDDDIRNTFALTTVLEESNLEVVVGSDGKEALALLEEEPDIDIVLMDIMMPEMDGYETMQKIREQPRYQKLPIIALTAKAMPGDRAKCIEAGANDYISKPVVSEKLLSLMRMWLCQ